MCNADIKNKKGEYIFTADQTLFAVCCLLPRETTATKAIVPNGIKIVFHVWIYIAALSHTQTSTLYTHTHTQYDNQPIWFFFWFFISIPRAEWNNAFGAWRIYMHFLGCEFKWTHCSYLNSIIGIISSYTHWILRCDICFKIRCTYAGVRKMKHRTRREWAQRNARRETMVYTTMHRSTETPHKA